MTGTVDSAALTRTRVWQAFKIALALVLVGIILTQVRIDDLAAAWQRLSIPWLLGSLLASWAGWWVMARRYWLLVGRSIRFREVLSLVIMQVVVGNLIATSASAISYLGVLRAKHQVKLSQGIASLVVARLADMLTLLMGLVCSSWLVWSQISALHWLVVMIVIGLVALVAALAGLLLFRRSFIELVGKIVYRFHFDRIALVRRILGALEALAWQELTAVGPLLLPVIGYTLASFAFSLSLFYCDMQLFAVSIGLAPMLFMLSLTQLIGMIPIQVFGGLGVYDVTSIFLFGLFGLNEALIMPVVVGTRLVFYLTNGLLLVEMFVEGGFRRRAA